MEKPHVFFSPTLASALKAFRSHYIDVFRVPLKGCFEDSSHFPRRSCIVVCRLWKKASGSTYLLRLHYTFQHCLLCQMSPLSAQRAALMRELHCSILEPIAPLLIWRDLCSGVFFFSFYSATPISPSALWLTITRWLAKTSSYRQNKMAPSRVCVCVNAYLCVGFPGSAFSPWRWFWASTHTGTVLMLPCSAAYVY